MEKTIEKEEIIETIRGFLVEEFEIDASQIQPEAHLKETLDMDSLDYVDLVVIIESHFGFKVTGDDFTSIHTFQDFYNFVNKRLNG